MKTQITLLAFLFLLVNVYANNTNSQNLNDFKSTFSKEVELVKINDTVKEKLPYKITRNEWTKDDIFITVRRVGDGNKVIFSKKQSGNYHPFYNTSQFKSTSGLKFKKDKKEGFKNVQFPAVTSFQSSNEGMGGYSKTKASNIIKVFEIQIDVPGIWEVTFNKRGGWNLKEKQRGQY